MSAFQRKLHLFTLQRVILGVVSLVWIMYSACYLVWQRPLAALVALFVSAGTAYILYRSYHRQASFRASCHAGLSVSALGLVFLCLLSGQQLSPFVWILTGFPVFAFCFLSSFDGILWTTLSTLLVMSVHALSTRLDIPSEFQVSSWEVCGYQIVVVMMLTLVSGVVKSLSVKHLHGFKQAVREAELSAVARNRFTSHVSHEMRHPLQSIIGSLELLGQEGAVSLENRVLLAQAKSDAALLCNLVDSTLLFVDLTEGDYVSQNQVFSIAELVEILRFRFEDRFAEAGVGFHFNYIEEEFLEGERSALEHIVGILLDNAHKFTSRYDSVSVDFFRSGRELAVIVSDTGPGMSQEAKSLIKEPFHRAGELSERRQRGFGLGLPILDKMVSKVAGRWGVESELGSGSRFWVRIPIRVAPEVAASDLAKLKIMVVDDDPVCLRVTRRLLENLGHDVEVCARSSEFVGSLAEARYDLIFLDCQMPEMDGYEVAQSLRAAGYEHPIVALTANTSPTDRQRCLESGMDGVVGKPASLAKLRLALQNYVKA